jgi:hypothetical protein
MKIISISILVLVFLSASLGGWGLAAGPNTYVVGGEYVLHTGDVVRGNLDALFAQITLEEGSRVDGRILAVSSALDLQGSVGGGILGLGSDIAVRPTATLAETPRQLELIGYVVLLPQMARSGHAVSQPQ